MFHACFISIALCSIYTLHHFYTFSGTNLLTRCQSVSSLFSAVFGFRNPTRKISSELHEIFSTINVKSGSFRSPEGTWGGAPRAPHHRGARPKVGPRPAMAWWPRSPTPSPVWTSCSHRNIIDGAIRFVRFREYFLNRFSETKNSRKQGTDTVASC